MEKKFGFLKMDLAELKSWLAELRVGRTILFVQQHHTFVPSYQHFDGSNHFEMQRGMKRHHVNHNGWSDIGQQFTTFPDGSILTGRSMERSPACIFGNNSEAVCIEHVGDFDKNKDTITPAQEETVIAMTAALCSRFGIPVSTDRIVYHHWFRLDDGVRNNGAGGNKSCPGTGFFGGNKVADCEANLLPHIQAVINAGGPLPPPPAIEKYVSVTANALNIRIGPGSSHDKADREPVTLGAVLRVFDEESDWLKISSSQQSWVSSRFTHEVRRAVVNADALNVRSGPGTHFGKVGAFLSGQEVFIHEEEDGWARVGMEEKWVSKDFLTMV